MKKLEKLTLKEFNQSIRQLSLDEASEIKGGGYWNWSQETGWTYMLDEVTVSGGSAGMVNNSQNELGVGEYSGDGNNPRIQEYISSCSGYGSDSPDSTPWCSAFVNFIADKSGFVGTYSASAASWLDWGVSVSSPQPGDVAISPDGHHVGIVTAVNGSEVTMISGNYSDSVMESSASGYTFRRAN